MDGKVRVAVRCRPLIPMETNEGCQTCITFRPEVNQIIMSDSRQFTFDYVFPPEVSQREVYDQCAKNLVHSIFEGFNATIFAYGQTGSGKTFTMGTADVECDHENVGIIPQVIDDLFAKIESLKESHECSVQSSFLEIYNEELHDLLDEPGKTLTIREHPDGGIQIVGLTECATNEATMVLDCLKRGADQRTVASTAMNERSSRSHAMLTLHLNMQHRSEADDNCTAKFHLVDLAGSERVKKTHAEGNRFKEGVNINRGLLALGNVISALCERESNSAKRTHIPYRDSRLTRILQDSLGGNSHTIMIACVSPADKNFEESLNTLRYADRARQIKNKPTVNRDPKLMEILQLKQLVRELQAQLGEGAVGTNIPTISSLTNVPDSKTDSLREKDKYLHLQQENRLLTEELDQAIDRATNLYRQVLHMELLQEQLNPRFEGLKNSLATLIEEYRSENRPPDVEDLEEQLKSITELQKSLLESEQTSPGDDVDAKEGGAASSSENAAAPNEENAPEDQKSKEVKEEVKEGDETVPDTNTDEEAEAAKARGQRVALHRELSTLDCALRQKERLLASMQANNDEFSKKITVYEEQILELSEKINKLENEREQLRRQCPDNNETIDTAAGEVHTGSNASNTRSRLRELESKLSTMRGQVNELKRVKREREQRESECVRLKEEINKLKAAKVRMVRQMAEDSAANKRWRAAKEMEVRKLQEKDRRMQNELAKMNAAHERRTAVLKRKMEAAAAAEKRLKETLLRQRESVNQRIRRVEGNDKSSVNIRVKNWLSGEIDKSLSIVEAKTQLDSLLEDRKSIAEQLAHARRAGRQGDVDELEMELRRRNLQIGNLQKILSDAETDDQAAKTRWDYLHSVVETRCGLKFMFKELIQCRSNLREKMAEIDDLNGQLRQQDEENHSTQTRLEGQLQHHETNTRELMHQVEQLKQENSLLKDRREEIERALSSRKDKGTQPPTPFLPKRKRRKVSEYEEAEDISSDEVESGLFDDPNDSDWHETPFMRRRKVPKKSDSNQKELRISESTSVTNMSPSKVSSEMEEKKPHKERISQSNKCRCRNKCQGRCGCRRSKQVCNENCRCASDSCGNRSQVMDFSEREELKSPEDNVEDDLNNPALPSDDDFKTERKKRFGTEVSENYQLLNSGAEKLPKLKRKLLDPRTTIFESPLLH